MSTLPPPPGGLPGPWSPQPAPAGQLPAVGAEGSWGSEPTGPVRPLPGPPGGTAVGPHPGWPPVPPPKAGGGLKWALLVLGLVAVLAAAAIVVVVVVRPGSGGGADASEVASATDVGPVGIIVEEPTCEKFLAVNDTLADAEHNGWDRRDPSVPASRWTADQRNQFEAVGAAMRTAADQLVALARQTPHRVVRELYGQAIAYFRAYADAIPAYTAADEFLAGVGIAAGATLYHICRAIQNGAAGSWAGAVPAAAPPTRVAQPGDVADPGRFVGAGESVCGSWGPVAAKYAADSAGFATTDSNTPVGQWTEQQKAFYTAITPVVSGFADAIEGLGRASGNPVVEDFAVLAAVYDRAWVASLGTYVLTDSWLILVGGQAAATVTQACKAVGG